MHDLHCSITARRGGGEGGGIIHADVAANNCDVDVAPPRTRTAHQANFAVPCIDCYVLDRHPLSTPGIDPSGVHDLLHIAVVLARIYTCALVLT